LPRSKSAKVTMGMCPSAESYSSAPLGVTVAELRRSAAGVFAPAESTGGHS
jgi:hypothetical protein